MDKAFFDSLFEMLLPWMKNFLRAIAGLVFFPLIVGFAFFLVIAVASFASSCWLHKAVLNKVRREEEGLPCFSEDFTHAFHQWLVPADDPLPLSKLNSQRDLQRLEQLLLAINDVNNAVLEAERAFEPARQESDFDAIVIKTVIARGVDAVEAMLRASRELTGFFGSDIKALILERGGSMLKVLQETNRLLALQEENRRQELELKQQALELKQQELAVREQESQNRTRKLELEQLRLKKANAAAIPLRAYLDFLRVKFDAITREELTGDNHARLFELYGALKEAFQRHHLLPPEQIEAIATDVKRLDQIETLIDLYSEKIRRVKEDDTLDPEEQQMKIDYWIRIRDRDITELEK